MEEKINITIPENISDITLGQFLRYEELKKRDIDTYNFNKRVIEIFTRLPFNKIDKIKASDYTRIVNQIEAALMQDVKFEPRFEMQGIKFGFIPNLDKITLGEYSDLSQYGVDESTLHNLMAVLFRPVVKEIGSKYEIMQYKGTEEFAELMKDMPLNCVNGALVFFYSLANELQEATQRCLSQELQKEMKPKTTSRTLDGIRQLKGWLKTISLRYHKSLS